MPGMAMGGVFGHKSSKGTMKLGKKVIGTLIKLQIAKYALKYGAKAAKAYFEYKLGRELQLAMIDKFVGRYHRQRTRRFHQRYYTPNMHSTDPGNNVKEVPLNITLGKY